MTLERKWIGTLDSRHHRRRIYLEAKANSRRLFLGENGGPLRLSSRRIDQGGQGQYFSNLCFDVNCSLAQTFILFGCSVAALWTHTWKDAGLNLTENF